MYLCHHLSVHVLLKSIERYCRLSVYCIVPLLRSQSKNSTKYKRIYNVSFGFKKSDDIGTKRQSTKRLNVCSHLQKRAAATSVSNIIYPVARWPTAEGCPTRTIINFAELEASLSSLKVSGGARLLQVALGWPRKCSTRWQRRCCKTSSTLTLIRIHCRKLYDSLRCVVESPRSTSRATDDIIRFSKGSSPPFQH
jgi:hypothetical protein